MRIHPTSVVSPEAELAQDVHIGPMCVVEDDVSIGPGCKLASHVVIKRRTKLGRDNTVDVGAVLGGDPQHLGAGIDVGDTIIGDGNRIREYVTIHRGYLPGQITHVGHHNMLMASSHVGHDCHVGDHNIIANCVMLGGHVTVGDRNYFGGGSAVHQFCRVASFTMIGGLARVKRDVPPFVLVDGDTSCLVGLNTVGLRRGGMPADERRILKEVYRIAFRDTGPFHARLARLREAYPDDPAKQVWEFLSEGTRGFLQDRGSSGGRRDSFRSDRSERKTPPSDPQESRMIIPFPTGHRSRTA